MEGPRSDATAKVMGASGPPAAGTASAGSAAPTVAARSSPTASATMTPTAARATRAACPTPVHRSRDLWCGRRESHGRPPRPVLQPGPEQLL